MHFESLPLAGAFRVKLDPTIDERGFFARTWCADEFASHGLVANITQCSLSHNALSGTLRGMHIQIDPFGEHKLVRCSRGAIYDVILDLRPDSPTYLQWYSDELTAQNGNMFFVPPGFAHGFQTLMDNTDVTYQMAEVFTPSAARGVRWNDPTFQIQWPRSERRIISSKDAGYPDFSPYAMIPI